MSDWARVCAVTLDYEGGNDDDPRDPGGRTSRGILQREWDIYRRSHPGMPSDVWRAPQAAIVDIYFTKYWQPVDGEQWPTGVNLVVYDAGVNSGLGKAIAWARGTLAQAAADFQTLATAATAARDKVAIIKRYQARRLSFLHALRTWAYFGKGWGNRVAGVEAIATRWALAAAGVNHEPVMQAEATAAQNKSNAAGFSAAATPAAPAAHVSTYVHHTWPDYVLTGIVIAASALLVAYLLHQWYVHNARAAALSVEAIKK